MKNLIMLFVLLSSSKIFAHGEDKLGPHNGFIRMPGTYHTELVPKSNSSFDIYLLDLRNQNAITDNSKVDLKIRTSQGKISFNCATKEDHFSCLSTATLMAGHGIELILNSTRKGIKGTSEAIYKLPLALLEESEHSGH